MIVFQMSLSACRFSFVLDSSVTPYCIIMKCLLASILLYHPYMKE